MIDLLGDRARVCSILLLVPLFDLRSLIEVVKTLHFLDLLLPLLGYIQHFIRLSKLLEQYKIVVLGNVI